MNPQGGSPECYGSSAFLSPRAPPPPESPPASLKLGGAAPGCGVLGNPGAETQARGRFRFCDPFCSGGSPASRLLLFREQLRARGPPGGRDEGTPARRRTRRTRPPAAGAPLQHRRRCPRRAFPKPDLVWPSGAAVPSTLLKGDRRLRQLSGGGSPRGPGGEEGEPGCAGETGGAASGGSSPASRQAGERPRSPPQVGAPRVSPRAGRLAGAAALPRAFL